MSTRVNPTTAHPLAILHPPHRRPTKVQGSGDRPNLKVHVTSPKKLNGGEGTEIASARDDDTVTPELTETHSKVEGPNASKVESGD